MADIVHILKHGVSYCGMKGVPRDWPPEHKWVPFNDTDQLKDANCQLCIDNFKSEPNRSTAEVHIRTSNPKTSRKFSEGASKTTILEGYFATGDFENFRFDTHGSIGEHVFSNEFDRCQVGLEQLIPNGYIGKRGRWKIRIEFEPDE
jgi:hypothetical protein